ncbi:PspC domain-containing protein [Arsukibacterium sp.]|uniref:PspC domain-containing protein n=1 Tax=Arsukibacterium sp. TaxID=1977258 RepID=UPI002FD96B30
MTIERNKSWYRLTAAGKISGVCAGLADYYQQPVLMVRVIAVVLLLCSGLLALAAYVAAAMLLPKCYY